MFGEILTINVILDGREEVKGESGYACMFRFHGSCDCPLFRGEILPGGVDTQQETAGQPRTLSARYIMEGTDARGRSARLFIENNGVVAPDGTITTTPKIFTDSEELRWLESAELAGSVESSGLHKVTIHICTGKQS